MNLKKILGLAFPVVMAVLMVLTAFRYSVVQDFKQRSGKHQFIVEAEDLDSVKKAIRDATYQPVESEMISEGKYRLVVRCPSDSVGLVTGLMQRMGCKRLD